MHRGENGSTDVIRDEPARDHGQIGAGLKDSVNSGETAAAERPEIANDAVSVEVLRECIAYAHDVGCADRIRIKSDQRNSVGLRVGAGALARAFDRLADCARSQRELDLAFTGTRDREHQRGCITKIAWNSIGPAPLGRSSMPLSFKLMSLNCFAASLSFSSS